jgi:hypothetical protein
MNRVFGRFVASELSQCLNHGLVEINGQRRYDINNLHTECYVTKIYSTVHYGTSMFDMQQIPASDVPTQSLFGF